MIEWGKIIYIWHTVLKWQIGDGGRVFDFPHSENPASLLSGAHTVNPESVQIFCSLLELRRDREGNFRIYRAHLLVEVTLFEALS